ncbi:MAG: J domain-containing protein [Chloroflexota bacterium]
MENYYKILGVDPKASSDQIKKRFRFLANAYHPDKFTSETHKANAEEEFKAINQAYQILSVPAKRSAYDRQLGLSSTTTSSDTNGSTKKGNDIYAMGQSFIRTVIFSIILSIGLTVLFRMGPVALIGLIILGGLIYTKYFCNY